jgi:hypothetical protein
LCQEKGKSKKKKKERIFPPFLTPHYSGAGKTVSAKYIMRYFATADDAPTTGTESMTEVEEQILGNKYKREINEYLLLT